MRRGAATLYTASAARVRVLEWRLAERVRGLKPITGKYAAVAAVTACVHLPALRGGFVEWDAPAYVVDNFHIRVVNLSSVRWAFTVFREANRPPLIWISRAADYALWGPDPAGTLSPGSFSMR